MSTDINRVFGAGFMLAALLASFAAFSQEAPAQESAELDGFEPAVDTSAQTESATAAVRDELQTAVVSAVLAQDVTRTQSGGVVMDRMELGRTEITGNQELPKVMYIVPWRKQIPVT